MEWFTADLHLGHGSILNYCKRPFVNIQEMDREIKSNFFRLLKSKDELYILGDLSLKREYSINFLQVLKNNGIIIHFIRGNHDYNVKDSELLHYCETVSNIKEITIKGHHITLCHYPMRSWNKAHHGAWHLYGHVHGRLHLKEKCYDVGVDINEFKPISFDQLKKIMKYKLNQDHRDINGKR